MSDLLPLLVTRDALLADRRAGRRAPWGVILGAVLLHAGVAGYAYGSGAQDGLLPMVRALEAPPLFARDALLQAHLDGVDGRTALVWLLRGLSAVMPLAWAVAGCYAVLMAALAGAVHDLAAELTRSRLAAALSVLLVFGAGGGATLGGGALLFDRLVPEGVAWLLAVGALTRFLRQRWFGAGALLGLATWFHVVAGGLTALLLALLGTLRLFEHEARREHAILTGRLRVLALFSAAYVVVALPVLGPVLLHYALAPPVSAAAERAFRLYVGLSSPDGRFFSLHDPWAHVRFWSLLGAGVAALVWVDTRNAFRHTETVARAGLVVIVLCGVGLAAMPFWPLALLAQLWLLTLPVLAVLLALISLGAALTLALPTGVRQRLEALLEARRRSAGAMMLAALAVAGVTVAVPARSPVALDIPSRQPVADVELAAWVRAHTPSDALVAVPPTVSRFRLATDRAVYVNTSAFVYADAAMRTWQARLDAVAPVAPQQRWTRDPRPALDAAFHALPADAWRHLAVTERLDYVLLTDPAARLPLPVAYRNSAWVLYDLGAADPTAAPAAGLALARP